jgi:hypothetical protein
MRTNWRPLVKRLVFLGQGFRASAHPTSGLPLRAHAIQRARGGHSRAQHRL